MMRLDYRGREGDGEGEVTGGREWGLSFLRSPVEVVSSPAAGKVDSVRLEINRLEVCCQQYTHTYWDTCNRFRRYNLL